MHSNGGIGISVGIGGLIQGNSVSTNVGFGISLPASAGYRENSINLNTGGTVGGGGTSLGDNLCDSSTTCP